MRVASVALVAVFSLAACAPRIARRPSPPPKAGWVVYPEAEVKDVKNAHEYKGAALCQRCHVSSGGGLRTKEPELCWECHVGTTMTHVGKIQSPPPRTLPYEEGGRIICHTCHDPHDVKSQKYGFRAQYSSVCLECHKRH
jgi:predicted CXXCH cytochrome family protein